MARWLSCFIPWDRSSTLAEQNKRDHHHVHAPPAICSPPQQLYCRYSSTTLLRCSTALSSSTQTDHALQREGAPPPPGDLVTGDQQVADVRLRKVELFGFDGSTHAAAAAHAANASVEEEDHAVSSGEEQQDQRQQPRGVPRTPKNVVPKKEATDNNLLPLGRAPSMADHAVQMWTTSPVAMLCLDGLHSGGVVMQNEASMQMYSAGLYSLQTNSTSFLAELCSGHQDLHAKLVACITAGEKFAADIAIKSRVLRAAMGLQAFKGQRDVVHHVVVQVMCDCACSGTASCCYTHDSTAGAAARSSTSSGADVARVKPPPCGAQMLLVTQFDNSRYHAQAAILHDILPREVVDTLMSRQTVSSMEPSSELTSAAENVQPPGFDNQLDCIMRLLSSACASTQMPGTPNNEESESLLATQEALWLTQGTASRMATAHSEVSILFADIVGFTDMCQKVTPDQVLHFLNRLFSIWDDLVGIFEVYKVETVGDCYMVAGGLFNGDKRIGGYDPDHAAKVLAFGMAMVQAAKLVHTPLGDQVQVRVGIHSGACVSGLVGQRMPRFCLFGDTINTASRMESNCPKPNAVHVSSSTRDLLPEQPWTATGGIIVKGKGFMETFWMEPPAVSRQSSTNYGGTSGGTRANEFLQELLASTMSCGDPVASSSIEPDGPGMRRTARRGMDSTNAGLAGIIAGDPDHSRNSRRYGSRIRQTTQSNRLVSLLSYNSLGMLPGDIADEELARGSTPQQSSSNCPVLERGVGRSCPSFDMMLNSHEQALGQMPLRITSGSLLLNVRSPSPLLGREPRQVLTTSTSSRADATLQPGATPTTQASSPSQTSSRLKAALKKTAARKWTGLLMEHPSMVGTRAEAVLCRLDEPAEL